MAIYPFAGLQAAKAISESFRGLRHTVEAVKLQPPSEIAPDDAEYLHDLLGFPEVRAIERKYGFESSQSVTLEMMRKWKIN